MRYEGLHYTVDIDRLARESQFYRVVSYFGQFGFYIVHVYVWPASKTATVFFQRALPDLPTLEMPIYHDVDSTLDPNPPSLRRPPSLDDPPLVDDPPKLGDDVAALVERADLEGSASSWSKLARIGRRS